MFSSVRRVQRKLINSFRNWQNVLKLRKKFVMSNLFKVKIWSCEKVWQWPLKIQAKENFWFWKSEHRKSSWKPELPSKRGAGCQYLEHLLITIQIRSWILFRFSVIFLIYLKQEKRQQKHFLPKSLLDVSIIHFLTFFSAFEIYLCTYWLIHQGLLTKHVFSFQNSEVHCFFY